MAAESPYRISRFKRRRAPMLVWTFGGAAALAILSGIATGGHPARADAVIVVAGPAKGFASEQTAAIATAVSRRVADINAAGGINGERLRIERIDDGCDAAGARVAAEQLARLKPAAILGHPCAGAALAAAEVYAKADLIYLALGMRHPRLTELRFSATVFRLSGREDRQGEAAGRYLAARFPVAAIAIVHDGAKMNRALADDVARTLSTSTGGKSTSGKPGERPMRFEIATKRKDYKEMAQSLKSAGAIVFAGFPMEAGLLLQALKRSGSTAQFLVTDSSRSAIFTDTFGESAMGVKAMAATGGAYPGAGDGEWADAAVTIFADAARRTGSLAPVTIASALQAQSFETGLGCLEFTDQGDAELCAAKRTGETAGDGNASGLVTAGYGVLTWDGAAWVVSAKSQDSTARR